MDIDQVFVSVSYIPLIAPSTTTSRIKFLASIADTFIYVVSKVRLGVLTRSFIYPTNSDPYHTLIRWVLQGPMKRSL
jgi:hypothetical protein